MAVTETKLIEYQPTQVEGLYTWVVSQTLTMDASGGAATIVNRLSDASLPANMLWMYLTEIYYRMIIVTSQAAQLEFDPGDWPMLQSTGNLTEYIGLPAPDTHADGYGAATAPNIFLPHPKYLGQAAPQINADVNFKTTNTDTGVVSLTLRGFATQKPINPFPYFH